MLSLDGVMQAPGGPDEDRDGGFEHGGWSYPYGDEDFGAAMVGWMSHADAFLLGRKTYEIFEGFWPSVTDASDLIAARLNSKPKYVVSSTRTSVGWEGSSLVSGDVLAEVARLKALPGDELQVHGSGRLAQTLIAHDLVDEFRLLWFPVRLGHGKRLFSEETGAFALRLLSATTTSKGVVITVHEPAGQVQHGDYTVENT
jgi:dihydrofolate reductase